MIRLELPAHLRTLARVTGEVTLEVERLGRLATPIIARPPAAGGPRS